MEQGKGADGFIAPALKAMSARGILALMAAALLAASGCGGADSDADTEAASGSHSSRSAGSTKPASSDASPDGGSGGESAEGGAQAPPSSGAKQSPSVAIPKGPSEAGLTPQQRESAKVASIALESPVAPSAESGVAPLPAAYTCDGKNSWPELRWRGVPAGTEELVLFAMSLAPVEGKLFFDWAVAGLDPALEGIDAGRLPNGAVMGRNGFGENGYSICPGEGASETYFFALYALPEQLSARSGFDPHALRKQVQEISRNVGILALAYARS